MLNFFVNGGPVMYPLLACSLIVTTVIIERTIFWVGITSHRDKKLLNTVMETCQRGDWEEVRRLVQGSKDYIIRILISGILHREFSLAKAMDAAADVEIKRMQRFMGILDTMITVAPLMGIFGTVIGIIGSFDALGTTGIEHPQTVTAGISQALITTASGLGIAILSVFPYNYFTARIETAAHEMEKYATSLEIVYEKMKRPEEAKREMHEN